MNTSETDVSGLKEDARETSSADSAWSISLTDLTPAQHTITSTYNSCPSIWLLNQHTNTVHMRHMTLLMKIYTHTFVLKKTQSCLLTVSGTVSPALSLPLFLSPRVPPPCLPVPLYLVVPSVRLLLHWRPDLAQTWSHDSPCLWGERGMQEGREGIERQCDLYYKVGISDLLFWKWVKHCFFKMGSHTE